MNHDIKGGVIWYKYIWNLDLWSFQRKQKQKETSSINFKIKNKMYISIVCCQIFLVVLTIVLVVSGFGPGMRSSIDYRQPSRTRGERLQDAFRVSLFWISLLSSFKGVKYRYKILQTSDIGRYWSIGTSDISEHRR